MGKLLQAWKPMAGGLAVVALALGAGLAPAAAQQAVQSEKYIPTIWIDPDGCEHWVMDDGAEGFMDIRKTRDGRPVCHRNVCGVVPTDTLFATDSSKLTAKGREYLEGFFKSAQARTFIVTGHTDSRASDEYNMRLSKGRAEAVDLGRHANEGHHALVAADPNQIQDDRKAEVGDEGERMGGIDRKRRQHREHG